MKQEKTGILKYIAGTGARGVKFVDEPETWYNPASDEAKAMVNDDFKGKRVQIMLADGKKTEFTSIVLLDVRKDAKVVVTEEDFDTGEVEQLGETGSGVPTSVSHVPVERDPKVIKETREMFSHRFSGMLENLKSDMCKLEYTRADYKEMEGTKLETAKKGPMKLTYASWAEAWGSIKRLHPTAQFHVYENDEGMPLFYDKKLLNMGAFVKVVVKVKGIGHTVHLPVMNNSNKSMKITEITTFDVNKSIMRALVKCIALHGLGLYVFKGEDLKDLE